MFVGAAVEANGRPPTLSTGLLDWSTFVKIHAKCYADCVEECGIDCLSYYAPFLSPKARLVVAKWYSKCVEGCALRCLEH